MNSKEISALFEKLAQGNCDVHDMELLNNWYHNLNYGNNDLREWFEESGGPEKLADQLYLDFQKNITLKKHRFRLRIKYAITAAASLIIIGTFSILFFQHKELQSKKSNIVSIVKVHPGASNAILVLANGSKLSLNKLKVGSIKTVDGVTINKTADGKLVYNAANTTAENASSQYNTIQTPRAGEFEVVLPDGTHAFLNAGSSLKYPLKFKSTERLVILSGEAYFEVAHNAKSPFKVLSGKQLVTVLGTHFNIKAYPEDKAIATTLLKGSVMVRNQTSERQTLLAVGEQSAIAKNSDIIQVSKANIDQVMAWKNGYFIFENESVEEIMSLISRWYDVDVEYHLKNTEHFGGTFSRSSDLKELLKNLESLGKTRFVLKERRVIVSN